MSTKDLVLSLSSMICRAGATMSKISVRKLCVDEETDSKVYVEGKKANGQLHIEDNLS